MSRCLSAKAIDTKTYQCKLEAYHGGNCEHIYSPQLTAQAMIKQRTTYQLIADFEETENQPMSETLPVVRGWLMDELERRDKAAFNAWLDSNEASPRNFYIGE